MCWSDETIINLIEKYDASLVEVYNYFELPQQRSDLGRYFLLYTYGGFYIDMDIEPGDQSLDILIDKNKVATSLGGFSGVRQSFIGSVPEHHLFKSLIDHIKNSFKRQWYECIDVLYVQRTTGGMIYRTLLDENRSDVYEIPNDIVYYCDSIDDCIISKNMCAMMHFEKSWNIFLYIQRFIVYYKYMMFFTSLFLLYIISGKCNSKVIGSLCDIRSLIKLIIFSTLVYNILYFFINKNCCRTGILYFCLLLLSYYSLHKKCDICQI
jgi:mannosyltransferase OCH1-like enzyme